MEYEVYSIGDPAFLAETLRAATTILHRDGLGGIVAIGFLILFMWTIIQGVLSGGREIKIQNIIVAGLIYAAFFGIRVERVNVWAMDSPELYQVEDVPLGLAVTSTTISKVGNSITDWFEQEYVVPGLETSEMGMSFALKALYEMRGLGFADGSLRWDPNGHLTKTLRNYVADCVVPGTSVGTADVFGGYDGPPAINLAKVVESDNAWEHLRWPNKVYSTLVYPYTDDPTAADGPVALNCQDAYDKITSEWFENPAVAQTWIGNIGISTCNEAGYQCNLFKNPSGQFDNTLFTNRFTLMRDAILGVDVELDKLLMNRALALAIHEVGGIHSLGDGDILLSAISQRASAQITANQALQQTMFEKMMLPLMTFFESLMFVAAPFAAILISFGLGGIQMIGKYLVFALWIQLWKPVAAVGNMFIQMSVGREMQNHSDFVTASGSSIASIASQPEMFDQLQHWIGVGGMLVASTPMITLMLMYGSAITASSLAGRIDMGKNADVGMDGFSGKSEIGDAGASLTKETGAIAMTNNQATDATQGSVSMGAAINAQAQEQRSLAETETKKAELARSQALESLTSAGVTESQRNSTGIDASGEKVNSQDYAEAMTERLVDSSTHSEQDVSMIQTGFNAKASAKVGLGKILDALGKKGVNTDALNKGPNGKPSISHLSMVLSALDGEVSSGVDYQDRFNQAASETSQLADIVDKSWAETETERASWAQGFSSSSEDSLASNKDWKDASKHSETYQQSHAKAQQAEARASKLESRSQSSAFQREFQVAALTADFNASGGHGQLQQFLDAKANQGDSTYAGLDSSVSGYRSALQQAMNHGKADDLRELLGMAGHNLPGVHQYDEPGGVGAMPTIGGRQVGALSTDGGFGLDSIDPSRREAAHAAALAANPDLRPENMTLDAAEQRLMEMGFLEEGEFSGVPKDPSHMHQMKKDAFENSGLREVGGLGKSLSDLAQTGVLQGAAEGASTGSAVGAAGGAALAAARAGLAADKGNALRAVMGGAARGGWKGAGWGSLAGAVIGAASAYSDYKMESETATARLNALNDAKNGDLTTVSVANQGVIEQTLTGIAAKQLAAIQSAHAKGEEFDVDSFANNELDDFERVVFEQSGQLMDAGFGNKAGREWAAAWMDENLPQTYGESPVDPDFVGYKPR